MNFNIPKISIITVTLNAAPDLQKTLDSITGQDWPDLEIIVIDGGSADDTINVIKTYAEHITYWISEPDRGIYDAMNKGLAKATGEWVNFMNAGDVYYDPQVLSGIFSGNTENSDLIYGDQINDYSRFKVYRSAALLKDLWKGMVFGHQTMFVRTGLIKPDGFTTEYFIGADYEMVYRLFAAGRKFLYIPKPLCIWNVRGISDKSQKESLKERYFISNKYGKINLFRRLYYENLFILAKIVQVSSKIISNKLFLSCVKLINFRKIVPV